MSAPLRRPGNANANAAAAAAPSAAPTALSRVDARTAAAAAAALADQRDVAEDQRDVKLGGASDVLLTDPADINAFAYKYGIDPGMRSLFSVGAVITGDSSILAPSRYKKLAQVPSLGRLPVEMEAKGAAAPEHEVKALVSQLPTLLLKYSQHLRGIFSYNDFIAIFKASLILIPATGKARETTKADALKNFLIDECHATRHPDHLKRAYDALWRASGVRPDTRRTLDEIFHVLMDLRSQPQATITTASKALVPAKGTSLENGTMIVRKLSEMICNLSKIFEPIWVEHCTHLSKATAHFEQFSSLFEDDRKVQAAGYLPAQKPMRDLCQPISSTLSSLTRYSQSRLKIIKGIVGRLDVNSPDFQMQVEALHHSALLCQTKVQAYTRTLIDDIVDFATYVGLRFHMAPISHRTKVATVNLFRTIDEAVSNLYLDLINAIDDLCNDSSIAHEEASREEGVAVYEFVADVIESCYNNFDISQSKSKDKIPAHLFESFYGACKAAIIKYFDTVNAVLRTEVLKQKRDVALLTKQAKKFRDVGSRYSHFRINDKKFKIHPWFSVSKEVEQVFSIQGVFKPGNFDLDNIVSVINDLRDQNKQHNIELRAKAPHLKSFTPELLAPYLADLAHDVLYCQSIQVSTDIFASLVAVLGSVQRQMQGLHVNPRSAVADSALQTLVMQSNADSIKAAERRQLVEQERKARKEKRIANETERRIAESAAHKARGTPLRKMVSIIPDTVTAPDWAARFRTVEERALVSLRLQLAAQWGLKPAAIFLPSAMNDTVEHLDLLRLQSLFDSDCLTLAMGLLAQNQKPELRPFLTQLVLRWSHRHTVQNLALRYLGGHPEDHEVHPMATLLSGVKGVPERLSLGELPMFQLYPHNFNVVAGKPLPFALSTIRDGKVAESLEKEVEAYAQFQRSLLNLPAAAAAAEADSKAVVAAAPPNNALLQFLPALKQAAKLMQGALEQEKKGGNEKFVRSISNAQYHLRTMQEAINAAVIHPQQRYVFTFAEALATAARGLSLNLGACLSTREKDGWVYNRLGDYQKAYELGSSLDGPLRQTQVFLDVPDDVLDNPMRHYATSDEKYALMDVLSEFFSRSLEALFMDGRDGANAAGGKYKDAKTVQAEFAAFTQRLVDYVSALTTLHLK